MFDQIKKEVKKELAEVEQEYKQLLSKIRTSRATTSVLDGVMVDYYGTQTPINQLASISIPQANTIQIQPWDVKSIQSIEKAIQLSDIGLNPVSDGKLIRIPIPPLSEERRQEILKQLNKYTEERRNTIRGIRRKYRDQIKQMEKDKEISEDEESRYNKDLQVIIDEAMNQIESLESDKEKHILED